MEYFKDKRVGIKAAIIIGVFTIIATILAGIFSIFTSNRTITSNQVETYVQEYKGNIELIQFTNSEHSNFISKRQKLDDTLRFYLTNRMYDITANNKLDTLLKNMEDILSFDYDIEAADTIKHDYTRKIVFDTSFFNRGKGTAILTGMGIKIWNTIAQWQVGDVHSLINDGDTSADTLKLSSKYWFDIKEVQDIMLSNHDIEGYPMSDIIAYYEKSKPIVYEFKPPFVIPENQAGRINFQVDTDEDNDDFSAIYFLQFEFYFSNNRSKVKSEIFSIAM